MGKSIKSWRKGGSGSVKSWESNSSWKKNKILTANKETGKEKEEKKDLDEEYELGPWSDWYWSEEFRFLYRGRKDRNDMWNYEIDTRSPEKYMPRYVPTADIDYVTDTTDTTDTEDEMYFGEPKEYILVTTICERVVVSGDGKRDEGGDGNGVKDTPEKSQQKEVEPQADIRSKQGGEECTCGCNSGKNGKGATGKQGKGDKYSRRRS